VRTFSDHDPNEPEERDPISYAAHPSERPEVFEKNVPAKGGAARAIAALGGVVMLLWLVASIAAWALGYSPKILISGIVSGAIGLIVIALSIGDSDN
jgi:hypothetical protein